MRRSDWITVAGVALAVSLPARGWAFNLSSAFSDGCHETISVQAAVAAGWSPTARAATEHERLVIDHLPLSKRVHAASGAVVALTVGVRDPDLRGERFTDLVALAAVHSDPDGQAAHCLRAPGHDGAEGDRQALAACRAEIISEVKAALGEGDTIDRDATVKVKISTAFERGIWVDVQRYGYHVGRALHTLQDSFTHTLRSPDGKRVRHVLNFVDWATGSASEARDGLIHQSHLDTCDGDTAGQRKRFGWAQDASTRLLQALADDRGGRAGRLARVGALLDELLQYEVGCATGNGYCDAPELSESPGCACSASGGGPPRSTLWVALALLALLGRTRRARSGRRALAGARRRTRRTSRVTLVCVALVAIAAPVLGQPRAAWGRDAARPAAVRRCNKPSFEGRETRRFGVMAALGAGVDRGGFAASVGLRWAANSTWSFGIDAEYNPWLSIEAGEVAPGSFNAYATAILHWFHHRRVALRSTVHVGVSVLLFDLVGAESGAVGPYVGLSLLGLTYRLASRLKLVVDPADVAIPIPSVAGVPIVYFQYRLTVGLQFQL